MNIKTNTVRFWTNSKKTLPYIKNQSQRLKTLVGNRVVEIHENSDPQNWFYIDRKENPADDCSRGLHLSKISVGSRWLASPEFLHKRDKQVSFQHSQVTDDLADDDAEIQKENMPIGSSHPSSRKISKVAEDIKGMQKERGSLRGTLLRLNPFIYTDGILRISTCLQHLKGHFCQFDLSRMPIASTDLASAAKGDFSNSFKELKTPEGSLAFAH
eukprot:gene12549-13836_t